MVHVKNDVFLFSTLVPFSGLMEKKNLGKQTTILIIKQLIIKYSIYITKGTKTIYTHTLKSKIVK